MNLLIAPRSLPSLSFVSLMHHLLMKQEEELDMETQHNFSQGNIKLNLISFLN